jgi:acyl-coenzyme A thioesterase PaaI-like protein
VLGGLGCVTVSLQTQFVSSARLGDFVVCRSQVIRRSKHLVFVRGLVSVDDDTFASAEGIWKVLPSRNHGPS